MLRRALLLILCLKTLSVYSSWYDQKLEGWYYFEDPSSSSKEKKEMSSEEAEELLEKEKGELKKLLALALINPTKENVSQYMKYQKQIVDQSNQFAQSWKSVLLEDPLLGDFLEQPTNSYGILMKKQMEAEKRKAHLDSLKESHFLLFFFDSRDPYSQKAWEVGKLYCSLHGWQIQAVSIDGGGLHEMDSFETDKGIAATVGLKATPSFFVVNPKGNRVAPIGAGLVTVSELEQNIDEQLKQGGESE